MFGAFEEINVEKQTATLGSGADLDSYLEATDIGGPAMLHSAAKNFKYVVPAPSPAQYSLILQQVKDVGGVPLRVRRLFAQSAFRLTGSYYTLVSRVLGTSIE